MTPSSNQRTAPQKKNWPPNDPPMFWVTTATLFVVTISTVITAYYVTDSITNNVHQNRPYINLTEIGVQSPSLEGEDVRIISPVLANLGNTPAVHVHYRICNPEIRDSMAPPHLVCNIMESQAPAQTLGPKQPVQLFGFKVEEKDLQASQTGKKFIYLFGDVTYDDAIGGRGGYITRFCKTIAQTMDIEATVQSGQPTYKAYVFTGCSNDDWDCIDDSCSTLKSLYR